MKAKSKSGFSVVEVAIVVTIIGILAALAIPLFSIIIKKSRFSALASDLRTYGEAFTTYALENADYPPSHSIAGEYVPELAPTGAPEEKLLSTSWLEPSPVGGVYTWVYTTSLDPADREAYIELKEEGEKTFSIAMADVIRLDEQIDDGNLARGYLQVVGNEIRYYLKTAD